MNAGGLHIRWINNKEKPTLKVLMEEAGRQTANLRFMDRARFAIARRRKDIVGWAGIDIHYHGGRFAELFSLYTYPEERQRGVGSELELIRYQYAMAKGYRVAYLRIAGDAAAELNDKRVRTKAFSFVETPDQDFVGFCRQCEYFGSRCRNPKILKVDLGRRCNQLLSLLHQEG